MFKTLNQCHKSVRDAIDNARACGNEIVTTFRGLAELPFTQSIVTLKFERNVR